MATTGKSNDIESRPIIGNTTEAPNVCKKVISIVFSSFVVLCGIAVPLAMICIGVISIDECRVEPMIPYFLIIFGVVCLCWLPITILFSLCKSELSGKEDEAVKNCFSCGGSFVTVVLTLFTFAWFICGNVWVFRIKHLDFGNSSNEKYCDELTYRFSFWMIVATYICSLLSCILPACIKCM